MPTAQIPDKLAERLNALMRPAKDVDRLAVMRTILATVADQPKGDPQATALAYAFENWRYACLSGSATPANAYQPPFDRDGRDRADIEATVRDDSIPLRIISLTSGAAAQRVDAFSLAQRTLALLGELPTTVAKVIALGTIVDGAQHILRPAIAVEYNTPLPDERFHGILWRNRVALAAAGGAITDDRLRTKGAVGHAFLAALAQVQDPEERANVAGSALAQFRHRGGVVTEIMTTAIPISPDQLREILQGIAGADDQDE